MDETFFDAAEAPEDVARRLDLAVLKRKGDELYARKGAFLFRIGRAGDRLAVRQLPNMFHVGEHGDPPRVAAGRAGLTVLEARADGSVIAADEFGRAFVVSMFGNGPMAEFLDWR